MRLHSGAIALATMILLPGVESGPRGGLSFEQRVEAQRAIERVYYSHQVGATAPFEVAVPRAVLENKVRDYLRKSVALKEHWASPVTSMDLETELTRIASSTRLPGRLQEIYDALGRDRVLILECFVRAVLVDRLARQRFAADERIHAAARNEAEGLRGSLGRGDLDPRQEHPRRRLIKQMRDALGRVEHRGSGGSSRSSDGTLPLVELPDRFVLRAVLSPDKKDAVQAAEYVVPRVTWDGWWAAQSARFQESRAALAASPRALAPGLDPDCRQADLLALSSASLLPSCAVETWTATSTDMAPESRAFHTAVWTGSHMVVWGGLHIDQFGFSIDLGTGGRYDPLTDSWSSVQMLDAPSPRHDQTAVWTGSHMVIWGGHDGSDIPVNSGGRYNPADNSWSPTSTSGAPEGRFLHTAVWTGAEMIVWGGETPFNVPLNSGGRYDPGGDTWDLTTTAGAPQTRSQHTAVWAGSQMVVWGGRAGGPALKSGGRYHPASDTWEPTSLDGAPEGGLYHTAVWTGDRMVVWGGRRADGTVVNSGALYDPVADQWSPTSGLDAPSARYFHNAVWDGRQMLIWGGNPGALNDGGRYDLTADNWTALSTTGTPPGRAGATAVWTGASMIVWGGGSSVTHSYLDSGGAYAADFLAPGNVESFQWSSDSTKLQWEPLMGEAVGYDVMLGDLDSVSDIGAASGEQCMVDNLQVTQLADTSPVPPLGGGLYFLIRAVNECGSGTYGWASSGAERRTPACP